MKEYQNLILAFFWEHPVAMMHKNYELSIFYRKILFKENS